MCEKLFEITLKTGRKIVVYSDDNAESPRDARTRLVVPGEVYSDDEPEDVKATRPSRSPFAAKSTLSPSLTKKSSVRPTTRSTDFL